MEAFAMYVHDAGIEMCDGELKRTSTESYAR
jgi:hypothetical protein